MKIVDLPIKMVILHSFVYVYQRVTLPHSNLCDEPLELWLGVATPEEVRLLASWTTAIYLESSNMGTFGCAPSLVTAK